MGRVGKLYPILFCIVLAVMLIASVQWFLRAATLSVTAALVVRRIPVRSGLLLFNLALISILVLYVTRYAGLILMLLVGALFMWRFLRIPEAVRVRLRSPSCRRTLSPTQPFAGRWGRGRESGAPSALPWAVLLQHTWHA